MTLEVRKQGAIEVRPPARERARAYLVGRRAAAVAVSRRRAWTAWQVTRQSGPILLQLMFGYSWRGLGRVIRGAVRYLRDDATAELRTYHADKRETKELLAASTERRAERSGRMLRVFTVVALALGPILAWTWPGWCGVLAGMLVFAWVLRLIPGRELAEVLVAAVVGAGVGAAAWWWAPSLPVPPGWTFWVAGTLGLIGLGWVGRPTKPLVTMPGGGFYAPKITSPMVVAALCSLGNAKMKEPDSVNPLSDPTRCGEGWQVDVELPGSVTASWVSERREEFAAALRRELGCVFLTVGVRHPGHLIVYVTDEPMAKQPQAAWPLLDGGKVDIFEAQPIVTDQRGSWVLQVLAYASMVIGAVPRMGKTFLLRSLLLIAALDPRVALILLDGKGTGDLGVLAVVARFYSRGRKPEEIQKVRDMLAWLQGEMIRRADFLDALPEEECPDSKVTSALADKYPRDLYPIVIGIDETQAYFDYGMRKNKEHREIRDEFEGGFSEVVRLGPALGIMWWGATQNVNTVTIPRSISLNAVLRACLKVVDHVANDQILGTGAYHKGYDATQLDFGDKGVLFWAGEGSRPQLVRSVVGMDGPAAKAVVARAIALRRAAGTLEEIEDAEIVTDIAADTVRVIREHSTDRAHLVEIVEWLQAFRPIEYEALTVAELGQRLRNAQLTVSQQVWRNGRNAAGVDLRKQGGGTDGEQL